MNLPLFLNRTAIAVGLTLASGVLSVAHSRVYEYTFTDINGVHKRALLQIVGGDKLIIPFC